jgi:hypothetical protein
MLVIHRVALLLLVHCCMCHGEILPLPIALCKWWSSFTIGKKGEKMVFPFLMVELFLFFLIFFFFFCFQFFMFFSFVFKGFYNFYNFFL